MDKEPNGGKKKKKKTSKQTALTARYGSDAILNLPAPSQSGYQMTAATSDLGQERWKKHQLSPEQTADLQNRKPIYGCRFKPLSSVIYYVAIGD